MKILSPAFCGVAPVAVGQEPEQPLKPPDLSSPCAAVKMFLETGEALPK